MDTSDHAQNSSPLSISTIGEDLTITGNVTSKGELHLNGKVQGDVHCVALVLGENAQLEGMRPRPSLSPAGRISTESLQLNALLWMGKLRARFGAVRSF
mgnify:CR=1 FL=1